MDPKGLSPPSEAAGNPKSLQTIIIINISLLIWEITNFPADLFLHTVPDQLCPGY